jgi:hypothetical protein
VTRRRPGLLSMMEDYLYRSRVRDGGEHLRNSLPHVTEALGEKLGISIPQLDVVASRRAGFEPDRACRNELHRLYTQEDRDETLAAQGEYLVALGVGDFDGAVKCGLDCGLGFLVQHPVTY